jgi:hypothetical protein
MMPPPTSERQSLRGPDAVMLDPHMHARRLRIDTGNLAKKSRPRRCEEVDVVRTGLCGHGENLLRKCGVKTA